MPGLKVFFRVLCLFVLLLGVQQSGYCQDSEQTLKASADGFFEKGQFVEATPLYLRLLALSPRSHDYNYRYGTCLLYNSYKKQDALKYLNYSVTDPAIAPEAFYYLGKAYHLNYQFNEAIKNYELYKQKAGTKIKPALELDRQVEMCQNGKRLLTTITDLVVLEKKEYELGQFFRLYNLSNIGGDLIVAADFQSKVDKKKGFTPLIHFPANSPVVFYASFGASDQGQKDIYMRRKLPDGSWGLPQPVPGDVNTTYDEDFPYMHPNGQYLYFCSKGHNSMGGYDVFRSKLNPETNSFGPPENMDFAISSPDNDLLYIVDSLDNNAYFASSRQSLNGKIHVYKVRVDRVPLQLAVVKGSFSSTINPDNKKLTITVTDYASGEKMGTFQTNEKGSYLITLPKGGKYQYEMKVDGSNDVHKYVVTLPFLKEFKPLKQSILQETKDAAEVVRVIDQFNEAVEDPMGVLAEVIRQRSELNPNATQFDLQGLDEEKQNRQLLAELGFANASPQEIVTKFQQLEAKQRQKVEASDNLVNGALTTALNNLQEAGKQQEKAKTLVNQANSATSKEQRLALLTEAQTLMDKAAKAKDEARMLVHFADSVAQTNTTNQEQLAAITAVSEEVRKDVAATDLSGLKEVLNGNSTVIAAISSDTEINPITALIDQKLVLSKEKERLEAQQASYVKTETALGAEIRQLEAQASAAKTKDQPAIRQTIDTKTAEQAMVTQEAQRLAAKIEAVDAKEDQLDAQINFLQSVTSVNSAQRVAPAQIDQQLAEVDTKNASTLRSYINLQVSELKKDPALAVTSEPETSTAVETLSARYEEQLGEIEQQSGLSETEKEERLLARDEAFAAQLDEQLEQVNKTLSAHPEDAKAQERKTALTALKNKTAASIATHEKTLAQTNATHTTPALTPESVLETIAPEYTTALENATGATPAAKLEAQNAVDRKLLATIDAELERTQTTLSAEPENTTAQERKRLLQTLKAQTEKQLSEREQRLAALLDEPAAVTSITPESVLESIAPDYVDALDQAKGVSPAATLSAQNAVDENLLATIAAELARVETTLAANPADQTAQERKTALQELKSKTEQQIAEREDRIDELDNQPPVAAITAESVLESIAPDYAEAMETVAGTTPEAKLTAQNAVDRKLLATIETELERVETALTEDPENEPAMERKTALQELKNNTEQQLEERTAELEALKATENTSSVAEVVTTVRPAYAANKTKILSTEPGAKQDAALLKEEKALLSALGAAVSKTEEQQLKNPDNPVFEEQLERLKETYAVQEAVVGERELNLVASEAANIDAAALQQRLAPGYKAPVADENRTEAETAVLISAETNLQAALTKQQQANEKKLKKSFDATVAAENKVIASLLEQSVDRVQQLNDQPPVQDAADAQEQVAAELGAEAERLLNSTPKDVTEAKYILSELNEYAASLNEQLSGLQAAEPVDEAAVNQKTAQLAIVRKRIATVEFELDAIENAVSTPTAASEAKQQLQTLTQTEQQLQKRLASGTLNPSETRATQKELAKVTGQKTAQEKVVLQETLATQQEQRKTLVAEQQSAAGENPLVATVIARTTDLAPATKNTKPTSAELTQQVQQETQAVSLLETTAAYSAAATTYKETGIVTTPVEQLQEQRRRFSIEIGQVESELEQLAGDPAKTATVTRLKAQQTQLKAAVQQLDAMIDAIAAERVVPNSVSAGLETALTYEKEVELASNPAYPALVAQQEKTLAVQQQLAAIIKDKERTRRTLAATTDPAAREQFIAQLKERDGEEKLLREELAAAQGKLDAAIATAGETAAEWNNLLARGVQPVQRKAVASELLPSMANGFELVTTPTATRTEKKIPVGLKAPSGLVYRVQVGAFAKPIPEDLFKEFTPVTGEQLSNGITRYLAGYFGNRERVLQAQKDIRALGYSDAFVVAYCDGNRISLAEARRLEDLGLCVPKNQDSIVLEVVEQTLAQLSPDSLKRLQPAIQPSDYNKAPGAAVAEAVEDRQGLFFTVQVGVYNRPVTAVQVKEIDPLITQRLENGQLRYSSGIFPSVDAARPKKAEAIARGITDAFITAYYKGARISLGEAEQILATQGTSVLEPTITVIPPTAIENAAAYAAAQPVVKTPVPEQRVQLVSAERYPDYPRAELDRYNVYGSFYYDNEDQRIKSAEYDRSAALPQLGALAGSVDTIFRDPLAAVSVELNRTTVVADWEDSEMSGIFADWLLRLTLPYTGKKTTNGFQLRFEDVPAEATGQLTARLHFYGARNVTKETNRY